jgi:hypothetical protein
MLVAKVVRGFLAARDSPLPLLDVVPLKVLLERVDVLGPFLSRNFFTVDKKGDAEDLAVKARRVFIPKFRDEIAKFRSGDDDANTLGWRVDKKIQRARVAHNWRISNSRDNIASAAPSPLVRKLHTEVDLT